MGPIALAACVSFIALLFWREFKRPDHQSISWAPFAWMFIAGSRFVSSWLSLRGPGGVEGYAEGSPVDRSVFFVLIGWGVVVLARRRIEWGPLFARNKWLVAYFAYCLVSITWTDAPDVLIKRWIKDLGNPIMALVLLTEQRPYDALIATIRRIGFIFVPLSIVFVRYYPELGRAYNRGGFATYTGVADQKNTLGLSCLMIGIAFAWSRLLAKRRLDWPEILLLAMWVWVVNLSDSATALTCLIISVSLFVCASFPTVAKYPTRIIAITTSIIFLYIVTDSVFHIEDDILAWLGRNETFTNRTTVWETVRPLQTSAWFGTGFMTFWNGDRMSTIWATIGPGINQAHNGYLEQYLNLGYVGVAFIILLAVSTLWGLRRQLKVEYPAAILRLCFILIAMLYNYTEASFYGINNMWVLFLAASMNVTKPITVKRPATERSGRRHPDLVPQQLHVPGQAAARPADIRVQVGRSNPGFLAHQRARSRAERGGP